MPLKIGVNAWAGADMNLSKLALCVRIAALVGLLWACRVDVASGAAPPWPEAPYTYYAENRPLLRVLADFGQQFGLSVKPSEQAARQVATVNGKITALGPSDFLNKLCAGNGLVWFYHGGALHISTVAESRMRSVKIGGARGANLKQVLTDLGILDARFGWGEISGRGVVLLSGPPAYVDLVAEAIANVPPETTEQHISLFRLRYASVDDRTVFYRDKQIETAGVATILRGLLAGDGTVGGTRIKVIDSPKSGLAPMAAPPRAATNGEEESPAKVAKPAPDTQAGKAGVPVVQADSRLNAVIIKDSQERMPLYEKLIAQIDVPIALVEIEAMIIDVDVGKTDELGVSWNLRKGSTTAGFGTASTMPETNILTYSRGTLLADAGSALIARVRALETSGDAKVVSRPSVLTTDNAGALFDLSETFHVQVVGERAANLVPVTTGVTLKVTPHIIESDGKRSVQLVIDLQDGRITDTQIQNLPTVRNSTLSTQASVKENESLLLGGYIVEENGTKREGVKGLAKLPVVGALFGTTKTEARRRERMFLITPRIVPFS
jgi:type III secretion protein C